MYIHIYILFTYIYIDTYTYICMYIHIYKMGKQLITHLKSILMDPLYHTHKFQV